MKLMILSLVLISFIGCSDFDHEWRNQEFDGRKFKKLVVVGLSHDLERRKIYEDVCVSEFAKFGIEAIKGLTIFPQEITEHENNYETITRLIIENDVDAVLLVKTLHESDHTYVMPDDDKSFVIYYSRRRKGKNVNLAGRGGYYTRQEKYYMIATFYDLHEKHEENEETAVWRAINEVMNPVNNIEKKKTFIRNAVKHLFDNKLIRVDD